MTTWTEVALALVGAPAGAAIAVLGAHLTNRSNLASQERSLRSQRDMQRDAAEVSSRTQAVQTVMEKRGALYLEIVEFCLRMEDLPDYVAYTEEMRGEPGPSYDYFRGAEAEIDGLRVAAIVYAPPEIESSLDEMRGVSAQMGDDPSRDALKDLAAAARDVRNCVAHWVGKDHTLHAPT